MPDKDECAKETIRRGEIPGQERHMVSNTNILPMKGW